MARVRKPQPTLEALLFATPEQRVLRLLIAEPTTALTPRVISSKLKGVRGLGGTEGIQRILKDLAELDLVHFVDNQRAVRLHDDLDCIQVLKSFAAICDLESLRKLLEPISTRGILYGSRAAGKARSDSNYNLLVVSDTPEEVRKVAERHPLGRTVAIETASTDLVEASLKKIDKGLVLWGSAL